MAFVRPQANITVYHPAADGITTKRGLQRDWRPGDWWDTNGLAEYIAPIQALGPVGDLRQQSMAGGDWFIDAAYSQKVRTITIPGNPATYGVEFYDGSVYAAGAAPTTYAAYVRTAPTATWEPNLVLRATRYAPPPSQGVVAQTSLTITAWLKVSAYAGTYYLDPTGGTWTLGTVSLCLPFESEIFKTPCIAWRVGDIANGGVMSSLNYYVQYQTSSTELQGGLASETWVMEWVTDPGRFVGSHLLVRGSTASNWYGDYFSTISPRKGPVYLTMAGCRQQVNVSPIRYSTGTEAQIWARQAVQVPPGGYEETASWGYLGAEATDWAILAEDADDPEVQILGTGYRPQVTFTYSGGGTSYTRPVVWLVTEDHAPTIAVPDGLTGTSDTEGDKNLLGLRVRVDSKWHGATATADFRRRSSAQYDTWIERGKAVLALGWQAAPDPGSGMAAATTATMWILPGGIVRGRDGNEEVGLPGMTLELGDLISVRLKDNAIVDAGQAGGMYANSWFHDACLLAGVPEAFVETDAALDALILPCGTPFPSKPHLAPQDGDSWEKHFDDVCKAAQLQWGYNPFSAKLFLRVGTPLYVPGTSTINFTIDYDSTTNAEKIIKLDHGVNIEGWRNRYKVLFGGEGHKQVSYWQANKPDEFVKAGGDLWAVSDDNEAQTVDGLLAYLEKTYRRGENTISWVMPLRRDLQPDQFVKIGDCPQVGLETNAVYQITEIEHQLSASELWATTECWATLVYSPAWHASVQGGLAANAVNTEALAV